MRIAIATAGLFHVLDLARELAELGHDVRFYSYVPRKRARRFGLPRNCHVALLPFAAPIVAWQYLAPRLLSRLRERLLYAVLNAVVILRLQPCDVFICMSGIYLEAARYAKGRYKSAIWLHRGSQHILAQDEILAAIPGAERPTEHTIRRECEGYALADRVVIPSRHVQQSFLRDPNAYEKLFLNPYGVDIRMFPERPRSPPHTPIISLFVGIWCLRKGCDLLLEAIRSSGGIRLIHVGSIGDLDFPTSDERFVHLNHVNQDALTDHYAAADLVVLPSREDGFGVVLSQALATGLPIICTDRTGGADLAQNPALAERVTVVKAGDIGALTAALIAWRDRLATGEVPARLCEADRQLLSWKGYGRRHHEELMRTVGLG